MHSIHRAFCIPLIQWIRLTVELTSNHLGYFEFRLCPKQSADELSTQQCFDQHLLTLIDGSTQFYVSSANELYFPVVQLPADVSCDYCVLQWRYTAGNAAQLVFANQTYSMCSLLSRVLFKCRPLFVLELAIFRQQLGRV